MWFAKFYFYYYNGLYIFSAEKMNIAFTTKTENCSKILLQFL